MRSQARFVLIAAALALPGAGAAHAQPMMGGGGGMPNLREVVGRPLPDSGMPTGTVSVRGARRLGATAGVAVTDSSLPPGRLEVRLFDENGAPIPNHAVLLGMIDKANKIDVRHGKSDAQGVARFADLPRGDGTGYAAVLEWHGVRLGTAPFPMPATGGARAEIRALGRTGDPAVMTIGAGGRVLIQ